MREKHFADISRDCWSVADLSPYNINALENRVVKRNEYMIREEESYWYFNIQILPTTCIEKV